MTVTTTVTEPVGVSTHVSVPSEVATDTANSNDNDIPCINSGNTLPPSLRSCPRDSKDPLTVFAKHTIVPGMEDMFEEWYQEISRIQREKWPGYISSEVLRPITCDSHQYICIFRYDSYQHLEAWMDSSDRLERIERLRVFSQHPPLLSYHSLEFWFVQPEEEKRVEAEAPPPKYKMAIVTFLVIFSTLQWVDRILARIFEPPPSNNPPRWVRQAIGTFCVVIVATYIAMPLATGILGFWLFPHQSYVQSLRGSILALPYPIPLLLTSMTTAAAAAATSSSENKKKKVKETEEETDRVIDWTGSTSFPVMEERDVVPI